MLSSHNGKKKSEMVVVTGASVGRAIACEFAEHGAPVALEHAAETVERELGPIDVWINNAMVSVLSPAMMMTAEEYRRVTGPFK